MSSLYLVNVGQWRSGPAKEGADELGLLFDNVEGAVFHPVAERNRSAHPVCLRRSPPEAARSGLDGGERGARLEHSGHSERRRGRADMILDWALSKRGLAASPCFGVQSNTVVPRRIGRLNWRPRWRIDVRAIEEGPQRRKHGISRTYRRSSALP